MFCIYTGGLIIGLVFGLMNHINEAYFLERKNARRAGSAGGGWMIDPSISKEWRYIRHNRVPGAQVRCGILYDGNWYDGGCSWRLYM